jgi:hypothetical protein
MVEDGSMFKSFMAAGQEISKQTPGLESQEL